jgi:hypothetical protein
VVTAREPPNWCDANANDSTPWIKALAEVRHLACRESWRYQHVQSVVVAIDQYAESALGNREFFLNSLMGSVQVERIKSPERFRFWIVGGEAGCAVLEQSGGIGVGGYAV